MRTSASLFLVFAALLHSSCGTSVTGSAADRGASAISRYGCGACHTIPGISGAHALVGPDLSRIGSRIYLAGSLENQPENMIRWLENPRAINSNTAMPVLGVSERDATDIAAYLYSLK